MATLLSEVSSVLGIEIGSVQTRAVYFDVVEESYQFIAAGTAPSTYGEPFFDILIGIHEAIAQLQEITGKFFLDLNKRLIIPSHGGVEGVDKLVVTLSCGPDLKAVTFGLFNDVSLASAEKLVSAVPLQHVDSIGINDKRSPQNQADALFNSDSDILILAGGSDRGATKSMSRLATSISSVIQLIPEEHRPKVLYCGNHAMTKRVIEILENNTRVISTKNIRPQIDKEELHSAVYDLNLMIMEEKAQRINGLERIAPVCSDHPILTSIGFNRVIQYLGKLYDGSRAVLGIDLGSAHTVAAFANHDQNALVTLPIGTGYGLENLLETIHYPEVAQWLPEPLPESEVMSYLWQKTLFPKNLPVTNLDQNIELAIIRHILSQSISKLMTSGSLQTRSFGPLIISGSSLTHIASPWKILLTLLDGIQPVGITPLVVDKHSIVSLLGAAAKTNPILPVQILESSAFINLATVITLESSSQPGTVLLQGTLQTPNGSRKEVLVRQGSISSLPLAFGEPGLLYVKSVNKTKISGIALNQEPLKVKGGVCGLVLDARGRPLTFPSDGSQRRELIKHWAAIVETP